MTDLTPEEKKGVSDFLQRLNDFSSGANRNCPNCGEPITGVKLYEKVEPETYSLYVLPCRCRLGLWAGAPQWVKDAGLIIDIVEFEGF